MYRILQEEGIDLPRYAVLNRDPDKPDGTSMRGFWMPFCVSGINQNMLLNIHDSGRVNK